MQVRNEFLADSADAAIAAPCVSILMPFEPQMKDKPALMGHFKRAAGSAEKMIYEKYGHDAGDLMVKKLKDLIAKLNFNSFKKSVAIFISPVFEKIIYLDIDVDERITVNSRFDIREIMRAKKSSSSFLLLMLNSDHTRIYLCDGVSLKTLNINKNEPVSKSKRDLSAKVANFSDENSIKEIQLENFLRSVDQALHLLLISYPLPVFVMGAPRVTGHYAGITRHNKNIVRMIRGNYENVNASGILDVLKPHLEDWGAIRFDDLKHQFEAAAGGGMLATGIRDVWKQANLHNARLLVMEENYSPAIILQPVSKNRLNPDYPPTKNALDEIIQKVLEAGGDVEIVEPGKLAEHHHILLIKKYAGAF